MAKPDLIQVTATRVKEVAASAAFLYVTVRGASVVRGSEALRKAKEVGELAAALTKYGLPAEDIQLRGISASREAGAITKSSSATYRLRVRVANLDQLPDLVGIVTSQKHASLEVIDWIYPFDESESERDELVEECVLRADAKARRMAKALGVRILGPYRVMEEDAARGYPGGLEMLESKFMETQARSVTREDLGLEMMHTKRVVVRVLAHYRISAAADGASVHAAESKH